MKYFSSFPIISYANNSAKNIMTRVDLDKKFKEQSKNFYPYEVKEGDRADAIAHAYYEDTYNDWMVYFANQVVDPYHDVYLSEYEFREFITSKYGSVANSQAQIYGYRNNWPANIDDRLTVSGYSALTSTVKKFWSPVLSEGGSIVAYERKKLDTYVTTNQILSANVVMQTNTNYTVGEKVVSYEGATVSGNAFVTFANSTLVTLKHINGTIGANSSYTIKGNDSGANGVPSQTTIIKQNIPTEAVSYYTSFSFYDYEQEKNEQRKTIDLIDARYSTSIEKQFRKLLKK